MVPHQEVSSDPPKSTMGVWPLDLVVACPCTDPGSRSCGQAGLLCGFWMAGRRARPSCWILDPRSESRPPLDPNPVVACPQVQDPGSRTQTSGNHPPRVSCAPLTEESPPHPPTWRSTHICAGPYLHSPIPDSVLEDGSQRCVWPGRAGTPAPDRCILLLP